MKTKDREVPHGKPECTWQTSAPAYVQAELSAEVLEKFEAHLAGCESCRQEVEQLRGVIKTLQAAGDEPVVNDLAPSILQKIPAGLWLEMREEARKPVLLRREWLARAAACLLCLLGGAWSARFFWARTHSEKTSLIETGAVSQPVVPAFDQDKNEAVTRALEWLCKAQEPTGGWSAEKWGGQKEYTVALTGLAMLALMNNHHETQADPYTDAIAKGARYILGQQNAEGAFGPVFKGTPYNHGIATLALLVSYEASHDPGLRPALDHAISYIVSSQDIGGGWGYLDSDPQVNVSVSVWQLQSLQRAITAGWPDVQPGIRKGVMWLTANRNDDGLFGYRRRDDFPSGANTLTAMGVFCLMTCNLDAAGSAKHVAEKAELAKSLNHTLSTAASTPSKTFDYYNLYFLTRILKAAKDDRSAQLLTDIHKALVERQIKSGANRGSWDASDSWSVVGGKIYSTALAALALQVHS